MKKAFTSPSVLLPLPASGCGSADRNVSGIEAGTYAQISQDEAMDMMGRDDGHVVGDVRRQDEYDTAMRNKG